MTYCFKGDCICKTIKTFQVDVRIDDESDDR